MVQFQKVAAFAAALMLAASLPALADSSGGSSSSSSSGGSSNSSSSGGSGGAGGAGGAVGSDASGRNGNAGSSESGTYGPLSSARSYSPTTGVAAADHARYSDTASYLGRPNLWLLTSLIDAGGGPVAFKAGVASDALAGERASNENDNLRQKFGPDAYKSYTTVFNYVVTDAVARLKVHQIILPKNPQPGAGDGQALSVALYHAGVSPATRVYNVEFMLDDLLSHDVHEQVMKDVDLKFGPAADSNFHVVLQQQFQDLRALYGAW